MIGADEILLCVFENQTQVRTPMRVFYVVAAIMLALVSLSGCETYGKGKGPIPVETNG